MQKPLKAIGAGSAVGLFNGLLGGGGGMVAVPALVSMGLGTRSAHATAIAVILPASLVSAIIYLLYGLVPFDALLPVAIGALLGGFLGANLLSRVPAKGITIAFAVFMLIAGVRSVLP